MSIGETAEKIKSMEIRGAGTIARAAAGALKHFAENYTGSDTDAFEKELTEKADVLLATRPTAITLWNSVQAVIRDVDKIDDINTLKETVTAKAAKFIEDSHKAVEIIGRIGAKRIEDGDVVLTTCNSKVALASIIHAFKEGKNIEVYATESRPWFQGHITVRALAKEKIPVNLIVDSSVRYYMKNIDKVLVGADTVTSNGVVINKIGTSQIALCAHEARVPFFVCAETYKFSPRSITGELVKIEERDLNEVANPDDFPGVNIRNPVFDATPPEYIDGIITEVGLIPPYAAYEIIAHKFGFETLMEVD